MNLHIVYLWYLYKYIYIRTFRTLRNVIYIPTIIYIKHNHELFSFNSLTLYKIELIL